MDKTKTVGQNRLISREDLFFLALKKCTKAQSNPTILSKVIVFTDNDNDNDNDNDSNRQTPT